MCTNVVHVLADVVATKLDIIFFFLPLTFLPEGVTYDFEFLHAFLSNKK